MGVADYLLCESRKQVERALVLRRRGVASFTDIVAVFPDAAWALRERGLRYYRMEDCYREAELVAMAEPALERLVSWSERVDDWLQTQVPAWGAVGFRPARLSGYFLKMFFDNLVMRTYVAARFIERVAPASVAFYGPPASRRLRWHLGFYESLYSLILPVVAARYGVASLALEPPRRDEFVSFDGFPGDFGVRLALRHVWRNLPQGVRRGLRRLREREPDIVPELTRGLVPDSARLCLGRGYDLESVRRETLRRRIAFVDWAAVVADVASGGNVRDGERAQLDSAWAQLQRQPFFWDLTTPEGVDLRAVAVPRLDAWWAQGVLPMWRAFACARERLGRQRVSAILTPAVTSPDALATQAAARSLGVPVASYQHGGFQGYCEYPGLDVADLLLADVYLTYGEGVAAYFERRRKRASRALARSVAVGSARLEALQPLTDGRRAQVRRRIAGSPEVPIVLYVPTVFAGYSRQLNQDGYADVPYFELQLRIFEAFGAHPEVCLAYKGFVSAVRSPVRMALARLCSSARYVMEPRLTELIWAADAVVIDYPSTGLLEAAATRAPIVLFADRECLRIVPEARDALARRTRLTETPDDFLRAVEDLLVTRAWGPLAEVDRTFEAMYSTHRRDGCAAGRALATLQSLAAVPAARAE